jgi:nucleoside diphosphate kinase
MPPLWSCHPLTCPFVPEDRWSYVLVTADAVVAGEIDWIVERLLAYGLAPRAGLVVPFGPRAMETLYGLPAGTPFFVEHPGGENVIFSLEIHDDLYRLSPACLLTLLRAEGDAGEALRGCKGNTRPELSTDGTLRSRGENVVFNLVHAPDGVEDATAELRRLFGSPSADALIEATLDEARRPICDAASIHTRLPVLSGRDATSAPAIINRMRARILQHLWMAQPLAECAGLIEAGRLLAAEREALSALSTSSERLLSAQAASPRIHAALSAVAADTGDAVIDSGLGALAALLELECPRCVVDVLALTARKVYLSPLEWVILRSHDYAFRPSDDLEPIFGRHVRA